MPRRRSSALFAASAVQRVHLEHRPPRPNQRLWRPPSRPGPPNPGPSRQARSHAHGRTRRDRPRPPRSSRRPFTAHAQRTRRRDLSLPAPARREPRRLAAVGPDGAGARPRAGQAAARLDRLLLLPLVSRDGARVLRGPAHRRADERELRVREGRPRGAPGRGRPLHGGRPGDDRPRRLAAERVPDARAAAVLRRNLLPPEPRHGMPAWTQVLHAIAESWSENREEIRAGERACASGCPAGRCCPPPPSRSRRARSTPPWHA